MLCRDIVPLGQTKGKWNYNLDEKRVLNFENVVNDDDNIKQDLSIGWSLPACSSACVHIAISTQCWTAPWRTKPARALALITSPLHCAMVDSSDKRPLPPRVLQ